MSWRCSEERKVLGIDAGNLEMSWAGMGWRKEVMKDREEKGTYLGQIQFRNFDNIYVFFFSLHPLNQRFGENKVIPSSVIYR
jgi:hypothetical protein